jgi:hypothetical protein
MVTVDYIKVTINEWGESRDSYAKRLSETINELPNAKIGRIVSVCALDANNYVVTWEVPGGGI